MMQSSLVPSGPVSLNFHHHDLIPTKSSPSSTPLTKWQQLGINIEQNCPDQWFRKIVQEIVDLYGWDNTVQDYALWMRVFGPSRFCMFFGLDQNSCPQGTVTMALYPEVGQLSLFYVRNEYRGLQLGHALFQRAIQMAGDRPVFLYGVADMWAKYAREFGMHHLADWRLWSMHARCADVQPEALADDASVELCDWRAVPWADLCEFDRVQTAGIDRDAYLHEALRRPESAAQVALCKQTGRLVGMCQARKLLNRRLGVHLFYAEQQSVASALLRSILLAFAGPSPSPRFSTLVYNTPSTNSASLRLFDQLTQGRLMERQELTPQFSRRALHFPAERIYCIGDEHTSLI